MDISEIEHNERFAPLLVLADSHDFERLRSINIDTNGEVLNLQVANFLDWAEGFLSLMPMGWEQYLGSVPADLKGLVQKTEQLLAHIRTLREQSHGQRGSALTNVGSRAASIMSSSLNSFRDLLMLQAIALRRRADPEGEQLQMRERLAEAEARISSVLASAEIHHHALEEMAAASKEATSKIAASGRARVFHNEALEYQKAARLWLGITITLGAGLIALSFLLASGAIFPVADNATSGEAISSVFGRFLIFVTIGAAVTFAGKQYGSNRHNAVQNLHRSSALRTYRALLAATRDEAVHDAILQQAASAIFAPTETGYSKFAAPLEGNAVVQLFHGLNRGGTGGTQP